MSYVGSRITCVTPVSVLVIESYQTVVARLNACRDNGKMAEFSRPTYRKDELSHHLVPDMKKTDSVVAINPDHVVRVEPGVKAE